MLYLKVFLIGGGLCALFQLLWILTKLQPTTLLKIGFILSAVLTPLGITAKLIDFGQCGFFLMVVGAGEAVYSNTLKLLMGNYIPFLQLLGVFSAIIILGVASGFLYPKLHKIK